MIRRNQRKTHENKMSHQELDKQQVNSNNKALTWTALIVKIILVYVIFAFASHEFFPISTYNLAPSQFFIYYIVGYLINFSAIYVPVALIAILIAKVPINNRAKPLQTFLYNALIATAVIAGLAIYGGWYANNTPAVTAPKKTPTVTTNENSSNAIKPVVVATTSQSSEGVTEADLDQAGLENLEKWMVNMLIKKGKNKYEAMGHNPEEFKPRIDANSVYVTKGDKKLAIIKISLDNSVHSVTIVGINGAELYRVNCLRASNHEIPVFSGKCGKEIYKVFAVSVQP